MSIIYGAGGANDVFITDHNPTPTETWSMGSFNLYCLVLNVSVSPIRAFRCLDNTPNALVWKEVGQQPEVINNNPGRSIETGTGATGFQISATRSARVSYSATITTTSSLSGNSNGYIVIETASTNSANSGDWIEIARIPSGQNNTVVLGVSLQQYGGGCAGGLTIAAGWYVKIRSVNVAGTPTFTLNSQQEILQ